MNYWIKYICIGLLLAITYLLLISNSGASYQLRAWLADRLVHQVSKPVEQPKDVIVEQARASYASEIARSAPSVVSIQTYRKGGITLNPNPASANRYLENLVLSAGSGVIIDSRGYVVTNYHVIKDANSISVRLYDGRQKIASLIGYDEQSDLAVLFIDLDNLPTPLINLERATRTGDIVFAIGNPYGRLDQTVTMGIISATRQSLRGDFFLQIDASIHPGNSGGALINAYGELVGFTAQQFTSRDQATTAQSGIGFGIPYQRAERIISELIANGKVVRGWAGFSGSRASPNSPDIPLTEAEHRLLAPDDVPYGVGFWVAGIDENGPAFVAGLQENDFVVQINGLQISYSFQEIKELLNDSRPGDTLKLLVYRNRELLELSLTLTEAPSPRQSSS